jgi:hypothetical protein
MHCDAKQAVKCSGFLPLEKYPVEDMVAVATPLNRSHDMAIHCIFI